MKKLIIIFVVVLACGCTDKIELKGDITEIKYNDTIILKKDYDKITKLLNKNFSQKKVINLNNTLTIKTTKDIYSYKVSDEYLEYNGKSSSNSKINTLLKNLEKKYNNTNFYKIDYMKNYETREDDTNIFLDKTSNYIVISLDSDIRNFKINEIEYGNNNYEEVDLLYDNHYIDEGVIVIRKSINYQKPDIKISFENLYNLKVIIVPLYDKNGNIKFKTTYKNA